MNSMTQHRKTDLKFISLVDTQILSAQEAMKIVYFQHISEQVNSVSAFILDIWFNGQYPRVHIHIIKPCVFNPWPWILESQLIKIGRKSIPFCDSFLHYSWKFCAICTFKYMTDDAILVAEIISQLKKFLNALKYDAVPLQRLCTWLQYLDYEDIM